MKIINTAIENKISLGKIQNGIDFHYFQVFLDSE